MSSTTITDRVHISLYARDLSNKAGWQTSDPFAVVTLLNGGTNSRIIGKTEVIPNSLNPNWTKSFCLDYSFGRLTHFNVGIWDSSPTQGGRNKPMGSALFEIGDVLGSPGNVKSKRLREGGILFVRVVKAQPAAGTLKVSSVRGLNLLNVEGGAFFGGKSDPFFTITRKLNVRGEISSLVVYRSDYCKNTLNPNWKGFELGMDQLCDGDLNQPILISVFDYEKSGRHVPMGTVDVSVSALVGRATVTYPLRHRGNPAGAIEFLGAQIVKAPSLSNSTYATPIATPSYGIHGVKQPTFVDYISGGCEIHMCVAIDFTGSNGDPRVPGTLHYINPDGLLNEYEKVLTAISSILMKYDSDKKIPVLGFGAKFHGVLNNCFQCGPTQEVYGINGAIDAYRTTLRSGLTLSGPTYFKDIIRNAASKATLDSDVAMRKGRQAYTVLLIITDGIINDVELTKQALMEGSSAPLSVVIIGVGNANFSAMQFLDDFMTNTHARDIVQFVQFSKHAHDRSSLTAATLEEIPEQLVKYFTSRNIQPLPMMSSSQLNITPDPYNEETDIDLSLDFKGEEEIVVIGNAPVIDQTSYVLPPPITISPSSATQPTQYSQSAGGVTAQPVPSAPYPPQTQQYSAPSYGTSTSSFTAPSPPYEYTSQSFSSPSYEQVTAAPLGPSINASFVNAQPTISPPPMFRVQIPPGVQPGQQVQVQNPKTGLLMLVTVPQGVAPGGFFDVATT